MDKYLQHLLNSATQKRILAIVILLLVLAGLSFATLNAPVHRWGDSSTYYMQVLSIVNDHDLRYTQSDIQRIMSDPLDDVPAGMYLIKTIDGRYFFSKDFTFALFASPFFALVGKNGILLFNALLLFFMILMGYLYLKKDNGIPALAYSVLFFVFSATFIYMFWMSADLYDAFFIMLGLFIWLVYVERSDVRYLAIASLALGLAAVSKTPNVVVFMPLALYELYKRRYTNLLIASGAFLLVLMVFYGYFYILSGAITFYGGNQLFYSGHYPFSAGFDSVKEAGSPGFSINAGNSISSMINLNDLKIIPYNLFYYFFGRFTGMLWYYPFAAFAILSLLFRGGIIQYLKDHPEKLCILGCIVLYILTFAIIIGNNYFGGSWAVGNRYFYIYPAFIFLLDKVDLKKLAVILALALVTIVPLILDPIDVSTNPYVHTTQSPYAYFPLDLSQLGNLPMLSSGYHDGAGNSFFVYGGYTGFDNGSLVVTPADMLILSQAPIEHLDLSLYSNFNNMTGTVSSNGFSEEVPLTGALFKRVTITDMKPLYFDSRQYVYDLKVEFN